MDYQNSSKIPSGWSLSKLEKVVEIFDYKRIPINVKEREERIDGKNANELYPYFGATGQVGWIDDYLFNGEFVLLGEDGAPFLDIFKNKAYTVNGKFWVNNHAHILNFLQGSNKFLCHYLNHLDFKSFVTGTTRLKLNQSSMKKIPVKIPPYQEQSRIVSKIEELFSELDNGIENLKKAQAQLKTYRQSVLKHAFEGKLTEEWRKENNPEPADKLLEKIKEEREKHYQKQLEEWKKECEKAKAEGKKKPVKPRKPQKVPISKDDDAEKLPFGWLNITMGNVLLSPLASGKSVPSCEKGFPVLKLTALKDGNIDLGETKQGLLTYEDAKRYLVQKNDLLISRGNGSLKLVGRAGLVEKEPGKIAYPDTMIKSFVCGKICSFYFLKHVWNSPLVRMQIEKKAHTTAGIYKINQQHIMSFKFPLPPFEEQNQIVQEIESRLSICDKMEQTIEDSLQKSEALRQSILKRAFEGKLVPQDPNDEPAEKLLERIKAEKSKLEKEAKKNKK